MGGNLNANEPSTKAEAPRKTDRRVVRTKRALFDAYERLVAEDENARITISALTAEADIDRKTFYLHFSSVDEMLDEMCSEMVARIVVPFLQERVVLAGDPHSNTPEEAGRIFSNNLRVMFKEFNDLLCENAPLAQRMFRNTSIDRLSVRFANPLARELKKYSTISDEALDHICTFFIGGLLSTYSLWLQRDPSERCDVEHLTDLSRIIINDGLSGYLSSPEVTV